MEKISIKGKIILGGLFFLIFSVISISLVETFLEKSNNNVNKIAGFQAKSFKNQATGKVEVLGETNNVGNDNEGGELVGDQYQIKSLVLGTNFGMEMLEIEKTGELAINDIKSELYRTKNESNNSGISLIVNCQTNKEAIMTVNYFKSGEKNEKVETEDVYGKSHHLALAGLAADSVYKYKITVKDRDDQTVESEQFVFYTGPADVSLLDVLEGASRKVFGWAIGR